MARTRSLTIRLIKQDAPEGSLLKRDITLKSTKLKDGFEFSGEIYYRPSGTSPPGWVGLLNEGATTPIHQLFSAHASALLLIRTDKQRFAISFGSGWQWLEEACTERRFGLLAALNCLEDDQIKVVDARQIDSMALSKRAQASHSSEITAFGLDVRRDLMRAIVGKPGSASIGKSIMGADALRIVCKVDFAGIGEKCIQLLNLARRKDYREKYPWVDNIEPVKDPQQRTELENELIKRINARTTEGIYLAPPRIVDLSADEEYRFHFDNEEARRFDVDFDDFLKGIRGDLPLSLPYLKKHKIEVFSGASLTPIDKFSVYSGIVFETSHKGDLYCLIEAEWYKISKTHAKFVNGRIDKIAKSPLALPNSKKSEKEEAYNKRAAKSLHAACLDRKLVSYGGGNSRVEICDVMTAGAKPSFIHVKKAASSQLLSHLFNQGVVAGTLLLEEEFRAICQTKSEGIYRKVFDTPFDPSKATITYALISARAPSMPQSLPFFSKQTLVNAVDLLEKFKYTVDFAPIGLD